MKVAFLTLGCKVNFYETEKMKMQFEEAGHTIVSFEEEADAYVINTCTVTNIADRKSRKMLHRARRKNPDAIIAAVGCYVDSVRKKGGMEEESVDLFLSNTEKAQLVEKIAAFEAAKRKRAEYAYLGEKKEAGCQGSMSRKAMEQRHTRAFLKVQDGCNQYCTYCIIPYVRGPLTSKKEEDVIKEAEELAKQGIQEIVITGIHLSSYGVDFTEQKTFLELEGEPLLSLLRKLSAKKGIRRIRLGSLEPRIMTETFVSSLAKIPNICPHFHLSLQSGCDDTLRRMNRRYRTKEYLDCLELLRKYFVHPAITTDIIVGFPQETEAEFAATCAFAEKAHFAQLHVFKYSRRQGTFADTMEGQVSEQTKADRSERLIAIGKKMQMEYQNLFEGQIEEVLFEEIISINHKEYLIGYNERYIRFGIDTAGIPEPEKCCNTIHPVRVLGHLTDEILLGEYS